MTTGERVKEIWPLSWPRIALYAAFSAATSFLLPDLSWAAFALGIAGVLLLELLWWAVSPNSPRATGDQD